MRETRTYSEEFRQRALQKLLSSTRSVKQVAEEIGIPDGTLYSWKENYVNNSGMKKSKKKKNNQLRAEEKLQMIAETLNLSENELGEYLRCKGLHSSDLSRWKAEFYESQKGGGRPKLDPEVVNLRKDKKYLEKELRRKERALAEVSARVVLLKKSREIFGESVDDE